MPRVSDKPTVVTSRQPTGLPTPQRSLSSRAGSGAVERRGRDERDPRSSLTRLSLQIKDEVRSLRAQTNRVKRKRAVGAAGAVVGTSAAVLLAVYGPALTAAIPVLGASGGIWQIVQAAADNSPRALHDEKWCWVWAIAKHNDISDP